MNAFEASTLINNKEPPPPTFRVHKEAGDLIPGFGALLSAIGPAIHPVVHTLLSFSSPVGNALVQVVSSEFFKVIIPKFQKASEKPTDTGASETFPLQSRLSMFLKQYDVLVTVTAAIQKSDDYRLLETLGPIGFERAIDWLETHEKQGHFLTYRVSEGNVSAFPIISDTPAAD